MILTEDNFMLVAAQHYDLTKISTVEEFEDDMKRFQYIKRLFNRYLETNELKTRLILNHITIIYNCLGPIATPMLFMKLEKYHECLKPFVVFLNFMPNEIQYNGLRIKSNNINMDENIIKELRNL